MLVYTALVLGAGYASPPTRLTEQQKNAALESFLLHFRNLRDFMCVARFWDDHDLFASDFLGFDRPVDVADRETIAPTAESDKVNVMLSHLSRLRNDYIEAPDTNWPTAEMAVRILAAFLKNFLGRVNGQARTWFPQDEWFAKQIRTLNDYAR